MPDFSLAAFEVQFLLVMALSFVAGYVIGTEREDRGKAAGVSTHSFVILGSALFTMLSLAMDPASPARVAAQIVTGVGFLGAGIILKDKSGRIENLTTAASIWFSASIGMALGFGWYLIAVIAMVYAVVVPRIPHIRHQHEDSKRYDA